MTKNSCGKFCCFQGKGDGFLGDFSGFNAWTKDTSSKQNKYGRSDSNNGSAINWREKEAKEVREIELRFAKNAAWIEIYVFNLIKDWL